MDNAVKRRTGMKKLVRYFAVLLAAAVFGLSIGFAAEKPPKQSVVPAKGIKVVYMQLGSEKCPPCRRMEPILNEIRAEYKGQVEVVYHDVWTRQGAPYGERYGVRAIPTQILFDSMGKEYYRHIGYLSKEELVKVLEAGGAKHP